MNKLRSNNYKIFRLLILAITLIQLGTFTTTVSAKLVLISYRYDENKITGNLTNYHNYLYRDVPDNAYISSTITRIVEEGWNYIRFEKINNYNW
ncbi:MAG: hypothetical protein ACTHWP_03230 [Ruoffia tabacinasalis]|uniref:Uncharacterized protein n=1 Tax=Ruoffia halotolerans TaxID=2748684 RepID=A0A839A7R8_9LACT|nr:hypothetical protein [Ruoffia halotolerans]MBA5730117.1 hypothetical protein [Ruoffia halotolerans]HBY90640.1 hypothetical protein [Aerococcaceae bacterium]